MGKNITKIELTRAFSYEPKIFIMPNRIKRKGRKSKSHYNEPFNFLSGFEPFYPEK